MYNFIKVKWPQGCSTKLLADIQYLRNTYRGLKDDLTFNVVSPDPGTSVPLPVYTVWSNFFFRWLGDKCLNDNGWLGDKCLNDNGWLGDKCLNDNGEQKVLWGSLIKRYIFCELEKCYSGRLSRFF